MKTVSSEQLQLLSPYQREYFNEFSALELDFNILAVTQQNQLEFVHLENIDELYSFMYSNLKTKLYKKFLPCRNDNRLVSADRSELAISICQSIIEYDQEERDKAISVIQNVQDMINHYEDFTVQYALTSKWSGQDDFKYTRNLLDLYNDIQEYPHLVHMCNNALHKSIEYIIDHDIDFNSIITFKC